jgi:N-acetylglucosaminyldiphosphoundecaprenol N-acetyl-beta-D-mannosaminyltransferase
MASSKKDKIFTLLGIPISNVTTERALEIIWDHMDNSSPSEIHFVNAHCINVAAKNSVYQSILQNSKAIFPDGSGIRKAGATLNHPIVDNVNGTDLFPLLCNECAKSNKKIYLLGGKPEVAEKSAQWANEYVDSEIIAGSHDGFFTEEQTQEILNEINESKADLLLVGMGVPRQELWIHEHLSAIQVGVVMGVGGLFDYYSGTIPRSPSFMRKLGIEWVWRLMMEPKRMWRRYIIGNIEFLLRIEKIRRKMKKEGNNL